MTRIVHLNSFQQKVKTANCKEMHCVVARGTGKTFILAVMMAENARLMPGSMRLLLGPSFRKTLTDLLPGIIATWDMLGYKRDVDYVIGNSPIPRKQLWPDPIYCPPYGYREHVIHWRTGAGYRIGSADRKVTLNGLNLDGIDADELKLIPEDIFNEILKTNRANPGRAWSHLPNHNSILTFTDKFWTRKNADWVMKKKALADPKSLEEIFKLQIILQQMTTIDDKGAATYSDPIAGKMINKLIMKLQNETIAFFEEAVYVNIPAIQPSFILQMQRNMGENEFRASMLNHDLVRLDGHEYFYPLLNEDIHTYVADNFAMLDNLQYDFDKIHKQDCTMDDDLEKNTPIEISCDWGGRINCLVVAQEKFNALNIINAMYVLHPEGIKQLAYKFNDYYKPHKIKDLNFFYDPSGNNKQANSPETLAEEFARHLEELGWNVTMMNKGSHNNPHYELRYELFNLILQPQRLHDNNYPYLFFNKNNCKDVIHSMLNAPVKRYEKRLKKDKSSEKSTSGIPPQLATNFSDAVDYIVFHKYANRLSGSGGPTTID